MPVTLNGTAGVTFNDATVQATAAVPGIGVGQTWQTPSRAAGTTYTNSTGKPILIVVSGLANALNTWFTYIYVDGVQLSFAYGGGGSGAAYFYFPASVIVPNGSTYSVTAAGGIALWTELR